MILGGRDRGKSTILRPLFNLLTESRIKKKCPTSGSFHLQDLADKLAMFMDDVKLGHQVRQGMEGRGGIDYENLLALCEGKGQYLTLTKAQNGKKQGHTEMRAGMPVRFLIVFGFGFLTFIIYLNISHSNPSQHHPGFHDWSGGGAVVDVGEDGRRGYGPLEGKSQDLQAHP